MGATSLSADAGHHAASEAPPYRIETRKLATWLFVIADAATFGAILFAYAFVRIANPEWTRPFAMVPTIVGALVMTLILLTSSLTMLMATSAAQAGRVTVSLRWLLATIVLGAAFAVLHLREWARMIGEGWSPSHNPQGGSTLVGATFFGITGMHLLHVIGGVGILVAIAIGYRRGRVGAGHLEATAIYWHFVDLVWMFVFPLVYLMNVR